MFSLSKWSDLFKSSATTELQVSATCTHDISDEWICVDDADNCEVINIDQHEVLDEATKARRRKWQKRLLKGRSQRHNSLPSKAKLRQRASVSTSSEQVQTTTTTTTTSSNPASTHQTQLRAKLKLAVDAAAAAGLDGSETPAAPKQRKMVTSRSHKRKAQAVQRGANARCIQQPSQRGMN